MAGTLAEFCQSLYPLMNAHADDFGRLSGDAFTAKFLVLPTSPRPVEDFETAIGYLHDVGLITLYVVGLDKVIQVNKFDENQTGLHKRTQSKFPPPAGYSGNVPEILGQEKGTKEKRTEEKGTEDRARARVERFDLFWSVYPNKVKKPAALKAWTRIDPDAALTDTICYAVQRHCMTAQWLKDGGEFIPHPASWLNGRRWEDQPAAAVRAERNDVQAETARAERQQRQDDNARREVEAQDAAKEILDLCLDSTRAALRADAIDELKSNGMYQRMRDDVREQAVVGRMLSAIRDKHRGPALYELRDKLVKNRRKDVA